MIHYTVKELSTIIKKSPSSIRSDLIRNRQSLPPSFKLPGSRKVLFIHVKEWLENASKYNSYSVPDKNTTPKKRGRPSIKSSLYQKN